MQFLLFYSKKQKQKNQTQQTHIAKWKSERCVHKNKQNINYIYSNNPPGKSK